MTTDRYSSVLSAAHNRAVPVDNFEDNFYNSLFGEIVPIFHGKEALAEKHDFFLLNQIVKLSK
jgi:hypothetical protein